MPNKTDTLAAIAVKHAHWRLLLPAYSTMRDEISAIFAQMLSAAYDAGRAAATEGAEVWYAIEVTERDIEDWYSGGASQFDTREKAEETARIRSQQPGSSGYQYRVVRQSLITEVVE